VTRVAALLRGVNLVKRNRVSMPALRELLSGLGYADVRTHLASGNVVLTTDLAPRTLERRLQAQIAEGLGVDVPVLVRTGAELADVVALDPLGDVATDGSRYLVTFLAAEPDAAGVAELEAADLAPERVVVSGREVYAWVPGGQQRSKLASLITDKRLGVVGTLRNWNTVTKLAELTRETPS